MHWSCSHLVSYMLTIFLPVILCRQKQSACSLEKLAFSEEYEYYQKGDIIIGGLISAHSDSIDVARFSNSVYLSQIYCTEIQIEQYKHILALIFTIDEINKNPELLPNVTLGYHIFDTCGSPSKSVKSAIQTMSGKDKETPNYSSGDHGEVAAFVINSGFHTNSALVQFLSLYKFTQVTYGSFDPLLSDKVSYPTLYQISSDDWTRYTAIVKCLQYFGWTWVGIITQENGIGEMESEVLSKLMTQHEICIDFTIKLQKKDDKVNEIRLAKMRKSRVKVIVLCGPYNFLYYDTIRKARMENITLIVHESWIRTEYLGTTFVQLFNCSLTFMLPGKQSPGFNIQDADLLGQPNAPLRKKDIWYVKYSYPNEYNRKFIKLEKKFKVYPTVNCTKIYDFPDLKHNEYKDINMYYVYTAVYILAHVLNRIFIRRSSLLTNGLRQELSKHIRDNVPYIDISGKPIYLNKISKMPTEWYLVNLFFWNKNGSHFLYLKALENFKDSSQEEKVLNIDPRKIAWKNGRKPRSRCNDPCPPGHRKAPNGGYHICCYDCVPCSEGEVSNNTDSEICRKCPKEQWPDEKKVKCLPRIYEFLSYKKDIISLIFIAIVLFFSAVTLFILGIFINYWNSPIVKANNRIVSFTLLVSILLGFLSVFFFLGRPVNMTCLLRQISFGIFFSIGVSSVLSKTIIVCIAFNASKPGSIWGKWLSVNVSYYVVLVCSSVQVLICVIWLLMSPPYVDFDHHSYPGKIIIQCNEGSDIWFYSMLGYLGFLAAVSFVLAFMVRTLPDSFNEAKYITFSMLVFCSVWIAMIPAYLSTRGKYMVAVEIFAIVTSCAGILGCIFFPKIYILLLKPNFKFRKTILKRIV